MLQAQMQYLNKGSLHENPFNIIEEDDVDDDFKLDLVAFVRKRYKNSINAFLF